VGQRRGVPRLDPSYHRGAVERVGLSSAQTAFLGPGMRGCLSGFRRTSGCTGPGGWLAGNQRPFAPQQNLYFSPLPQGHGA
jgi:hypothetical protein